MNLTENRPVFLNLLRIRQPVTAVVSIFHRITGILMVLLLPGLIYLLQISLSGPEGFAQAASILDSQSSRVVGVLITWIFAHHLFAGIRFLLLDFDVGVSRNVARKSAWVIHLCAAIVTVLAIGILF